MTQMGVPDPTQINISILVLLGGLFGNLSQGNITLFFKWAWCSSMEPRSLETINPGKIWLSSLTLNFGPIYSDSRRPLEKYLSDNSSRSPFESYINFKCPEKNWKWSTYILYVGMIFGLVIPLYKNWALNYFQSSLPCVH